MTFDLAKFRIVYPQFDTVDDALIIALAEQAECYLPRGCEDCLDQLAMLLVAHMLSIRTASGAGGGLAGNTSTSVEKTAALWPHRKRQKKHLHERGEDIIAVRVDVVF